jgi:hypothetical protein
MSWFESLIRNSYNTSTIKRPWFIIIPPSHPRPEFNQHPCFAWNFWCTAQAQTEATINRFRASDTERYLAPGARANCILNEARDRKSSKRLDTDLFLFLFTFATSLVFLPIILEDSTGAQIRDRPMEPSCGKRADKYGESDTAGERHVARRRENESPSTKRSLFGMKTMTIPQHSATKDGVSNQARRQIMPASHRAPFLGRWKKSLVIVRNPESLSQFFEPDRAWKNLPASALLK